MALAGKNELAGSRGCARDVRSDGPNDAACARPVRLAAAGKRILERSDSGRRGGALPRHGYDALSQTVKPYMKYGFDISSNLPYISQTFTLNACGCSIASRPTVLRPSCLYIS